MEFEPFKYDPEDGIKNSTVFPDTPVDSAAAREQFQRLYDQARDAINGLQEKLCASDADSYIGSQVIGLEGTTVREQLTQLKHICDELATGVTPPDYITDDLMGEDVKIGSLATLRTVVKDSITAALNDIRLNTKYINEIITSDKTFTAPQTGVYKVTVVGGGAGGAAAGADNGASDYCTLGGSSGGTAIKWIELEKGDTVEVSIGQGGAGGEYTSTISSSKCKPGAAGGTSRFGDYCYATGGEAFGDTTGSTSFFNTGKPGMGYGGDINLSGHKPASTISKRNSSNYPLSGGYAGGDSYLGVGGYGHNYASYLGSGIDFVNGIDASGYGSGGSGTISNIPYPIGAKGGKGADGVVMIEYFGYAG